LFPRRSALHRLARVPYQYQAYFAETNSPLASTPAALTLAGFLPTLEKHIRINANLTTVVRIRLESMFASLEQLRGSLPGERRGG